MCYNILAKRNTYKKVAFCLMSAQGKHRTKCTWQSYERILDKTSYSYQFFVISRIGLAKFLSLSFFMRATKMCKNSIGGVEEVADDGVAGHEVALGDA